MVYVIVISHILEKTPVSKTNSMKYNLVYFALHRFHK